MIFISLLMLSGYAQRTTQTVTQDDLTFETNHEDEIAKLIAFRKPSNSASIKLNIPNYIDKCTVTSIGEGVFANIQNLVSIKLPKNLISIENSAFKNCMALSEIEFPTSLEIIKDHAFFNCDQLEIKRFTANIMYIGDYAFSNCKVLKNTGALELPTGIQYIGEASFSHCSKITSFSIKSNALYTSLGGVLFRENSLILFPSGLKSSSYNIPEGTQEIRNYAFAGVSALETIVIPESIEKYTPESFKDSSIKNFFVSKCSKFEISNATCIIYPDNCDIEDVRNDVYCNTIIKPEGGEFPNKEHHKNEIKELITIILPFLSILLAVAIVTTVLRCRKTSLDQMRVTQIIDNEIEPNLPRTETMENDDFTDECLHDDDNDAQSSEPSVQYPSQIPYEDDNIIIEDIYPLQIQEDGSDNPYNNVSSENLF